VGNITQLYRYQQGNGNPVDKLTYNYAVNNSATNQLQSITDNSGNDFGLKAGNWSYAYDSNGNMVTDNSKGITGNNGIIYNLLNLPQSVTLPNGTLTYTYDAAGNKLRKVSTIGSGSTVDYISGIQYKTGGTIDFIQTAEGRAINNSGSYIYEYRLVDHLGNTRVSFDQNSGTTARQQDDYYPFGMEITKGTVVSPKNEYLYNNKELQVELSQYDYGARFYDPVIARWTTADPMAEKSFGLTPYRYAFNNPIRVIDPDGAYETDGHFWTVYLMETMLGNKNAYNIAYYTEAPDNIMNRQGDILSSPSTWLNPISQYRQHAITGGSAADARMQAWNLLEHASGPEELGSALHYFGDSFAHRNMLHPNYMYVPTLGHLLFGHTPDKIARRPDLYKDYVRTLAFALGGIDNNVDMFTFDYIADCKGTTQQNSAILETEVRIREGVNAFDVAGDFADAVIGYINSSNSHFGRHVRAKAAEATVTHYKKNSEGEWVEDSTEQRTFVKIQ